MARQPIEFWYRGRRAQARNSESSSLPLSHWLAAPFAAFGHRSGRTHSQQRRTAAARVAWRRKQSSGSPAVAYGISRFQCCHAQSAGKLHVGKGRNRLAICAAETRTNVNGTKPARCLREIRSFERNAGSSVSRSASVARQLWDLCTPSCHYRRSNATFVQKVRGDGDSPVLVLCKQPPASHHHTWQL